MARRRNYSSHDNVFSIYLDVFSLIPPYFTLPLSVFFYFVLHHLADIDVIRRFLTEHSIGIPPVMAPLPYLLLQLGQFIIPALLAGSACIWTVGYLKRSKIQKMTLAAQDPDNMAELNWSEFEKVVAQAFVNRGYDADMTATGADGGVDVILKKNGLMYLVQAKHWKSRQVSADTVRSLYGVMQKYGAVGCYVVSSGSFTGAARDFATGLPITLITGTALRNLVREGSTSVDRPGKLNLTPTALETSRPLCTECGHTMLLRTAKKGIRAGQKFWGCADFPTCTKTIPLD